MAVSVLQQCIKCGFLENGVVDFQPCTRGPKHDFEPLSRQTIAKALGSAGGRPPKYATEEERQAVRREQKRVCTKRYRDKKRKEGSEASASGGRSWPAY